MQAINEIKCPACGQPIKLQGHPQCKDRLVAYHDCQGHGTQEVYSTDNPGFKPVKESK